MAPETPSPPAEGDLPRTMKQPLSVTVIIAATASMGMSFKARLPWPKLEREHHYFESTTKRVLSDKIMNAIIMGYNTWDKEPPKDYPDRINVVVARNRESVWPRLRNDHRPGFRHVATSIADAVDFLQRLYPSINDGSHEGDDLPFLGRIFIIGGAGICRDALEIPWVDRLLLTRVMADFRSDTFFPLPLDGNGNKNWVRQSDDVFLQWGGAEMPIGVQCENGIEWEAYMFERSWM